MGRLSNYKKKIIGGILFIFFLILFLKFSVWFFQNFWIFFILVFILAYFLEDDLMDIIKVGVFLGGIFCLIYLIGLWQKESLLFGITINSQFMLVLLTAIYVIFTYINFRITKKHSEISRLPYLTLNLTDDLDIYIKNNSDKLANNLEVKLIFLNPKKRVINRFKEMWYYNKKVRLESLEWGKDTYLPMEKIIETLFPVKKQEIDSKWGDEFKTYKLKKGEKEFKIKLIIECSYSSDTYFETFNPIKKEFNIFFKKDGTEIIKSEKDYGDWEDIS